MAGQANHVICLVHELTALQGSHTTPVTGSPRADHSLHRTLLQSRQGSSSCLPHTEQLDIKQ